MTKKEALDAAKEAARKEKEDNEAKGIKTKRVIKKKPDKEFEKKKMTETIDQQMIFDRLPLTAEQRKRLYDAIASAKPMLIGEEPRTEIVLEGHFEEPNSPVQYDPCPGPLFDSLILKTH